MSIFGSKVKNGFKAKTRTKQEIDADYTYHSVQLGHKTRIIYQLQQEIEQHTQRLIAINEEAMALPKEQPAPLGTNENVPPTHDLDPVPA